MAELDQDALLRCAHEFRDAMEACDLTFHPCFADFPRGSCGDASLVLGEYLRDCGFGEWKWVNGFRGVVSHAWLEQDGVILDITADQFDDVDQPVVLTTDRTWHAQFTNGRAPFPAGLDQELRQDRPLVRSHRIVVDHIAAAREGALGLT